MSNKEDQKTLSERAMQKKLDKEQSSTPNHPPADKTPSEGLHPIEREKPIDLEERAEG